jgi:phage-related protein
MSREIADAAPDVVSFARSLTSVLASIVQIVAAVPDGTGSVLAVGLITKWLFGAATKVFPSLVAGLALVPAQVAAIAVAYGMLQNQFAKLAQNQEGTPQWLLDADKKVRGYLDFLNAGNAADVQAGLAQAMERQRLEKKP